MNDGSFEANSVPLLLASSVCEAFERFQETFTRITLRARSRFENRDLRGTQQDAAERLELYDQWVAEVAIELAGILGEGYRDKSLWVKAKESYGELIEIRYDIELAQTFFNSVTRRVHVTSGVDSGIEFYDSDFELRARTPELPDFLCYPWQEDSEYIFSAVLEYCRFSVPYENLRGDCLMLAGRVRARLEELGVSEAVLSLEMLTPVFYRDGGAYLIGRLVTAECYLPIAVSLRNREAGIICDGVLLDEDSISILFSFAHSYFFVTVKHHRKMIEFFQSIMPRKRVDELYSSIGHHKHGKTELHRNLRWHLARSKDRFEVARGKKGMVMVVFTLPSYDVVFKVIRDKFAPPKKTDHQRVKDCYELVFKHDRVGRLVDAQEFVDLEFRRDRFEPQLLAELLETASESVTVSGPTVSIRHLYTERRVTPLDLYIHEVDCEASRLAIMDYGKALKELAAADLFPGDLFLKNFGVTRHGRVVFYDYDELSVLEDCNFRKMPTPRYDFEEFENETWFAVAENDIFPEEFRNFIGIPKDFMDEFLETHGELFTPEFWRSMKDRHAQGEFIECFPYDDNARFSRDYGS